MGKSWTISITGTPRMCVSVCVLNLTNQNSAGFNYRSSGRRSPMTILMTITRTLVNTLNNFIWLLTTGWLSAVIVVRVRKAHGPQEGPVNSSSFFFFTFPSFSKEKKKTKREIYRKRKELDSISNLRNLENFINIFKRISYSSCSFR